MIPTPPTTSAQMPAGASAPPVAITRKPAAKIRTATMPTMTRRVECNLVKPIGRDARSDSRRLGRPLFGHRLFG